MTIVSTTVATSDTAESTDFNNLRADVLQNHIHDGTDGPTIVHSDLTHPNSYAIVNEHEAVDGHIAAVKNEHGKGTTTGDEFIAGIVGGDFAVIPFELMVGGNEERDVNSSGYPYTYDFSSIVTMANADYKIFFQFPHFVWYKLTTRNTTGFSLTLFTKNTSDNMGKSEMFQILILGVPARP